MLADTLDGWNAWRIPFGSGVFLLTMLPCTLIEYYMGSIDTFSGKLYTGFLRIILPYFFCEDRGVVVSVLLAVIGQFFVQFLEEQMRITSVFSQQFRNCSGSCAFEFSTPMQYKF